jgi:hypothetical protein
MKNLSLILVLIFGFPLVIYSQENNRVKLIEDFYRELCIKDVAPEEIVSNYIGYSGEDQYNKAIHMVIDLRNLGNEESGHFFLLKRDISENDFFISSYDNFSEIDKAKFKNLAKNKRKNVYKINLKNTIPQYILMEKDKIISFFGFQKAGSDDHIFIVF